MTTQLIGKRLKVLRNERGLSQEELASIFGFKDRQTVSAIETGVRRITVDELVLAVEKLGVPLEYFTDPFRLVGEGRFSWRHTGVETDQLREYEYIAGCWIAAFRALAPKVDREIPLMRQSLGLTRRSSYEDAMLAGERFVAEFELGDAPAKRLSEVMEQKLGILVLMVDTSDGISGAACRLPELDTVLITRHEIEGRRHFDLAHELFHILTWNEMPPEHSEDVRETSNSRVEQLADNFAGAVLMPSKMLERDWNWGSLGEEELIDRLNIVADELHVTSSALRWRLVALGQLRKSVAQSLPGTALRNNDRDVARGEEPAMFSKPFVEVLGRANERGLVSMRRVAKLLNLVIEDVEELYAVHGLKCPIEL